jgi:hypothetical protein
VASRKSVALLAILTLAAVLRLRALDSGWFGVDQARDLTWAARIASGEAFPAVGPAMRNRVHLPPTYYDFWAIPAFFSDDPIAFYAFAALLGVATTALVARLASGIGGARAGLLAALVFATSPIAVIDGRVAWAPAALPLASAVVLLAARRFLVAPSALRAAGLMIAAGLAPQLHLAAVPLALVAGVVVLRRARELGARGLVVAAAAALATIAPALYALTVPVPHPAPQTQAAVTAGRARAMLELVPRVIDGLSRPSSARPGAIDAWIAVEHLAVAVATAALLWLWLRARRGTREASAWPVPAGAAACALAVGALPGEAWSYYLDTLLVPAAVAVGLAVAASRRAAALVLLALVVAARVGGIAWWEEQNARTGDVPTNLDQLRLGGPEPESPDSRARVLTVATRESAARVLLGNLGLPLEHLWQRAHGAGFTDLDTDNGFFFIRAGRAAAVARAEAPGTAPGRGDARDALVVFAGELPADWLAAFSPAERAGPLAIYGYSPYLRESEARLLDCGTGGVPRQAPRSPLDYGDGERALPTWSCPEPTVVVPVERAPSDVALRVLARTTGAARILSFEAEGGQAEAVDAPGAGTALRLATTPTTVKVRLRVDGPASLDVYELHGAADRAAIDGEHVEGAARAAEAPVR